MKVIGLNPTLQVHDLKKASDFYINLGFDLDWIGSEVLTHTGPGSADSYFAHFSNRLDLGRRYLPTRLLA